MKAIVDSEGIQIPTPRIAAGLQLLLQSRHLARDAERDLWEFAVEKEILYSAGTNYSDLRWMICHGIIQHAYEVKEHGGSTRQFSKNAELAFDSRSCFVLTAEGERFAQRSVRQVTGNGEATMARNGRVRAAPVNGSRTFSSQPRVSTPTWDGPRHQLRVESTIVKEYKLPSPNQETILAAFEEEGWPPCIDDPLPVHPDLDPKRRLHDTIKSLNRNQRTRRIRFMGDGTGEGVRWEWIGQEATDGH
jgi:hypothetical protein